MAVFIKTMNTSTTTANTTYMVALTRFSVAFVVIGPPRASGRAHQQNQTIDARDDRFPPGLDRRLIDVTSGPGGAAIIDATGLRRLQAHGHRDPVAQRETFFDVAGATAHHGVEALTEAHHRDDGENREDQPLG